MPIVLNGTTFNNGGTVTFNGSTVKEIKFGTTTVWKSVQYIVGHEGNDTVQASYSGGNTNWYGNPLQCKGVWSVDVSGYSSLTFDLSAGYTWYVNPDNPDYHVNRTTKFGYSTSAKTVGTAYYQNTFVAYHQFTDESRHTYTFDVSGVSGTIYLWIGNANGGGGLSASCSLYNIYLS